MKKYRVTGAVVGSKYLGEFEAESKDAAVKMAMRSPAADVRLCHVCSSECEDPQIDEYIAEEVEE